jgi:hypothetical protein
MAVRRAVKCIVDNEFLRGIMGYAVSVAASRSRRCDALLWAMQRGAIGQHRRQVREQRYAGYIDGTWRLHVMGRQLA